MQTIATDVAMKRRLVCVSVCSEHGWAVRKRLNGLRCRLKTYSRGPKEACITWDSRFPTKRGTLQVDMPRIHTLRMLDLSIHCLGQNATNSTHIMGVTQQPSAIRHVSKSLWTSGIAYGFNHHVLLISELLQVRPTGIPMGNIWCWFKWYKSMNFVK